MSFNLPTISLANRSKVFFKANVSIEFSLYAKFLYFGVNIKQFKSIRTIPTILIRFFDLLDSLNPELKNKIVTWKLPTYYWLNQTH